MIILDLKSFSTKLTQLDSYNNNMKECILKKVRGIWKYYSKERQKKGKIHLFLLEVNQKEEPG